MFGENDVYIATTPSVTLARKGLRGIDLRHGLA